jgi:hypothetical protein
LRPPRIVRYLQASLLSVLMDHPCYKCGNRIEDGKAFCLQCGAAQIRVAMPEPAAAPVAESVSPDVSLNVPPAFSLDRPGVSAPLGVPALSTGIEWRRAFRACAIAALISLAMMFLRLMVPPLATLGAGCLAVILYHRRSSMPRVDARSGAQLGAVTSLLSSAVFAIFSAIVFTVLQAGGQIREQLLDALQQVASRSNDPQMQAALDLLKKPDGLAAKFILGMVGFFLISVAAGSIGGALTGAFFGRRSRP